MIAIVRDYRTVVETLKSEEYAEACHTALADLERKHATGEIEDDLYAGLHEQLV